MSSIFSCLLNSNIAEKADIAKLSITGECITGEYFAGKPVYAKLLDVGALPNATSKDVNTGLTGVNYCWIDVAHSMCFNSGASYPFPYVDPAGITNSITGRLYTNYTKLNISTKANWGSYSCIVCLKYTKV